MPRSREAFWWSLFSAGGVLAALFIPALALATGFLLPTTEEAVASARFERLTLLLSTGWWQWLIRLGLFAIMFLGFFHAAHRIRHTLIDLGLRHAATPLAIACYGGAAIATLAAAWVLATL